VNPERPTTDPAPSNAGFRRVLLVALAVLLVASLVTLVKLYDGRRGDADDQQAQREVLMSQTEQFVKRLNTYGPSDLDSSGRMPHYRELVKQVITPKFAASFEQSVGVAEQSVAKYGLERTCKVYGTGVEVMDSDSAQVLVAGSFSQTFRTGKGDKRSGTEPAPFRLRVSLVRIGDTWLVDDYKPITGDGS
jgi:hypothetical protein